MKEKELSEKTAAQKRQETMSRKRLQDQAELRELEASTKVPRKAMVKALKEPVWKQKRASSPTAETAPIKRKKVVTSEPSRKTASTLKLPAQTPKAPAPRRQPAAISDSDRQSSEDSEEELALAPKTHSRKSKAVNLSDDEAEDEHGNSDDDDGNLEEDEVGDVELEKLDAKALKEKLRLESVQWAASEDEGDDSSADNAPRPDLELTTASEGDFFAGGTKGDSEEDLSDEEIASVDRKKMSKRELDRHNEVPQWKRLETDDKNGRNHEKAKDEDVNNGWGRATYIPAQSGRLISIMVQPPELQRIIRAAIRRTTGDVIFENAYVSSDEIISYNQKILASIALELKEDRYASRFKKDHNFGVVVGRVLSGRVSNFRGNLKKVALSKVEGFYQLVGPDCKSKVEQLIKQTSYVFPRKEDGTLIKRTKPFHHLAIVSILRQVLDEGNPTLAEKHDHRFTSSVDQEPRSKEREMPAALVVAVSTAIHSALDDYSTGICIKTEFNADVYEDVYRGHITTLTNIRRTNPDGYHRLMADLHDMTLSGGPQRSGTIASNAIELIEFGGMDV